MGICLARVYCSIDISLVVLFSILNIGHSIVSHPPTTTILTSNITIIVAVFIRVNYTTFVGILYLLPIQLNSNKKRYLNG